MLCLQTQLLCSIPNIDGWDSHGKARAENQGNLREWPAGIDSQGTDTSVQGLSSHTRVQGGSSPSLSDFFPGTLPRWAVSCFLRERKEERRQHPLISAPFPRSVRPCGPAPAQTPMCEPGAPNDTDTGGHGGTWEDTGGDTRGHGGTRGGHEGDTEGTLGGTRGATVPAEPRAAGRRRPCTAAAPRPGRSPSGPSDPARPQRCWTSSTDSARPPAVLAIPH